MRKLILIATSLVLSVGISACGNKKGKAKVAAAIATGDKGTIKKAGKDVDADLSRQIVELEKNNYFGMSEGAKNNAKSAVDSLGNAIGGVFGKSTRTLEQNEKVLSILNEIKNDAEAVVKAGNKSGAQELAARGEKKRVEAVKCIDEVQKEIQSQKEKEERK